MRLKFGDQVKRLQRPDMIYSKNISQISSGLIALQIQQRTQLDNDKVLNMMRSHPFFYQHTNEFMIECCKVAKYEVLQRNLRLFKKGFGKLDRLVIILTGELGVYLNSDGLKIELTSIRHFGSLCFILGSDYFADMYNINKNRPDIEVLCKTQCIAATIDRAYYTQNLMTQEISKMTKEITMLYQFKIFNQITYGHIRKFYANSLKQTFSTLDVIYTQNSAAQLVYLVLSGIFELREEKDGAVSSISIVSPGQLIGDQEIVKQIPLRQQTAYCISEEGIVLMFDSSYYITHMLPIIKHNFEQKVIRKKPTLSLHQTFYQRKLSQDEIKLQVKLPDQIFLDKQVIVNKEYYTRYKKMNKKVKPQHEFLSHSNSKRRNYQSFYQAQDFSQQVGTSGRNLFSNQKLTSLKNEQSPFRLTKIKSLSILINKFQ